MKIIVNSFFLIGLLGVAYTLTTKTDNSSHGPLFTDPTSTTKNAPEIKNPDLHLKANLATPTKKEYLDKTSIHLIQQIKARYAAGDYHSCRELALEVMSNPSITTNVKQWTSKQLPTILNSSGWLYVQTERCKEAIPIFKNSLNIEKTMEADFGLATCYHKLQLWNKANKAIYRVLSKGPSQLAPWSLFAEIMESQYLFDEALDKLSEGLNLVDEVSKPALKAKIKLLKFKSKNNDASIKISNDNFYISFPEILDSNHAEYILNSLQEALEQFISEFSNKEPSQKIEVIIYQAQEFTSAVPNAPHWASGIFDGRIRIPYNAKQMDYYKSDTIRRVLRHELVHALLFDLTSRRRLPSWFDEGLADWFAYPELKSKAFSFPVTPGQFFSAKSLEKPFSKFDKLTAERLYRQSIYLILVIYRNTPEGTLATIVQSLSKDNPIDSRSLLNYSGQNYEQIIELASQLWSEKSLFGKTK